MPPATTLGQRIKIARALNNVSQRQTAKDIGISSQALSAIEHNGTDPRASVIKALAEYLHVTTDFLLDRQGDVWAPSPTVELVNRLSVCTHLATEKG